MPIDVEAALASELPAHNFAWDEDRVILYQLGLGAGSPPTDPRELAYAYEGNLAVLPSFGTIAAHTSMVEVTSARGVDINWALLLHGEQDLDLKRPIPPSGEVVSRPRIAHIYDKGRAALMVVEVTSTDRRTGELLFTNRSSLFIRGEGGWGGDPGPKASNQAPAREPDHVARSSTLPQQALLYRLSGDKNPLHADPAFAALGGFDRPILHGLCTYGIVCKAAVGAVLGGDPRRVHRYQARFAGVVFPGETVITRMWVTDDKVLLEASVEERDATVLSNAALWVS
ncbi:MAG: 3-alpha,7-alpha,12-alpha-trihydroxy-5-beta-cholest-24-enoyl-CoA hydratase [Acidimicrobiia bacterium]|nr:3-alpha,7-alpha,12-alpha-trihydroxy-5-beta-cholest-24-enoyl-CoA hydratase [Acidimicrobiia bacterium]MYH06298.1 3-alpha,7-alpha,12-alpha-trihydroxy-5-beta-cholest-24-enoyl-CoA hydratase [Acidimicrobiia bacterium]MYK56332.1 3-alpha,7-alpha,12-alpha-trihydroxy-5-beta-cholest-24-enoyl-CoA hydratase [Acidimicrobiia bacterium]